VGSYGQTRSRRKAKKRRRGSFLPQMHYGVANDLAARCLLLLALVGLGGTLVFIWAEKRR
jgi:hypothetical protein